MDNTNAPFEPVTLTEEQKAKQQEIIDQVRD